jgi:hypothetical protein
VSRPEKSDLGQIIDSSQRGGIGKGLTGGNGENREVSMAANAITKTRKTKTRKEPKRDGVFERELIEKA